MKSVNPLIMVVFNMVMEPVLFQGDCWFCIIIIRELAFLYSQVVIYLNTLAMLTPLSQEVTIVIQS